MFRLKMMSVTVISNTIDDVLTLILARPRLEVLLQIVCPHPPVPVHLPMMQPEYRLTGADIHITSGISPDRKVT